ncbi:hypothetical protein GJ496_010292 [Pomphorhynchus laevis]|nr:hypothetical protein GJ496_010292 [Pomphorhynchus laevis]
MDQTTSQCIAELIDSVERIENMICRLAATHDEHNRLFNQQRNERDFTYDQLSDRLYRIFYCDGKTFLHKFGDKLTSTELDILKNIKLSNCLQSDLDAYISTAKIRESKSSVNLKRNRRFVIMKAMDEANDEYFQLAQMRERNPLLFEQTVGKFKFRSKDDDLSDNYSCTNGSLTSWMMNHCENIMYAERVQKEELMETGFDPCEQSDSDDSNNTESNVNEFKRLMREGFLNGNDKDFDYQSVDMNASLDYCCIVDRDMEEAYFDND